MLPSRSTKESVKHKRLAVSYKMLQPEGSLKESVMYVLEKSRTRDYDAAVARRRTLPSYYDIFPGCLLWHTLPPQPIFICGFYVPITGTKVKRVDGVPDEVVYYDPPSHSADSASEEEREEEVWYVTQNGCWYSDS
jgi:hypothetical protein